MAALEAVAATQYGNLVASAGEDQVIRIWDVERGKLIQSLSGHTKQIWSVEFSPDGNRLVSGSGDRTAKMWDVKTGECRQTLQGHTAALYATFSPDGRMIATGSYDTTVRLWVARYRRGVWACLRMWIV